MKGKLSDKIIEELSKKYNIDKVSIEESLDIYYEEIIKRLEEGEEEVYIVSLGILKKKNKRKNVSKT